MEHLIQAGSGGSPPTNRDQMGGWRNIAITLIDPVGAIL